MRRAIAIVVASGLAALVAGAGAGAAGARSRLPELLSRYPPHLQLAVRPAVVNYSNDGSGAFGGAGGRNGVTHPGHLRWSSWTRRRAVGHGVDWVKSCRPDCAAGHWHRYPATLIASDPRGGVFRRLTDHESDHGRRSTTHWRIVRYDRSWVFDQIMR